MNRSNFLKSFGIGAVGLIIPNSLPLITQKPIKVYENYLKGTSYYKVERHKNKLHEGDELRLEREATNPYDSFAISVHYQKHKIGYIAAYENIVLANLFDQQVKLSAFVSHLDFERFYEPIAVEVYADLISYQSSGVLPENLTIPANDAVDSYRQGIGV